MRSLRRRGRAIPPSSRAALTVAAFAFSAPAQVMVWTQVYGIGETSGPVIPYQLLIVGYLIGAAFLYGRITTGSWADGWPTMGAAFAGIALGLYATFLHHSTENVRALANFVEHMTQFVVTLDHQIVGHVAQNQWVGALVQKFIVTIGGTLKRNYLEVAWGENLFRLIYWLVTGCVVVALIRRRWRLAFRLGRCSACRWRWMPFRGFATGPSTIGFSPNLGSWLRRPCFWWRSTGGGGSASGSSRWALSSRRRFCWSSSPAL
jgi:hypothetical protein